MVEEIKKLGREICHRYDIEDLEDKNEYQKIAYDVFKIAFTVFNDELFDKAVAMAKAIRDFGDAIELNKEE